MANLLIDCCFPPPLLLYTSCTIVLRSWHQQGTNAAATPDWIRASVGVTGTQAADGSGVEKPASGGGLDWLAQAAQPEDGDSTSAAAGTASEHLVANTSKWLLLAAVMCRYMARKICDGRGRVVRTPLHCSGRDV